MTNSKALGCSKTIEQLRIDCDRADDVPYLTHQFAEGCEEGPIGNLRQMPTVALVQRAARPSPRLCRIRHHVARDDCDRGMRSEPGIGGGEPLSSKDGDPAPFHVADNAGVPRLRRQAQSSMPITQSGSAGGTAGLPVADA